MLEMVCWVFGCCIPEPSNPLLEGEDDGARVNQQVAFQDGGTIVRFLE